MDELLGLPWTIALLVSTALLGAILCMFGAGRPRLRWTAIAVAGAIPLAAGLVAYGRAGAVLTPGVPIVTLVGGLVCVQLLRRRSGGAQPAFLSSASDSSLGLAGFTLLLSSLVTLPGLALAGEPWWLTATLALGCCAALATLGLLRSTALPGALAALAFHGALTVILAEWPGEWSVGEMRVGAILLSVVLAFLGAAAAFTRVRPLSPPILCAACLASTPALLPQGELGAIAHGGILGTAAGLALFASWRCASRFLYEIGLVLFVAAGLSASLALLPLPPVVVGGACLTALGAVLLPWTRALLPLVWTVPAVFGLALLALRSAHPPELSLGFDPSTAGAGLVGCALVLPLVLALVGRVGADHPRPRRLLAALGSLVILTLCLPLLAFLSLGLTMGVVEREIAAIDAAELADGRPTRVEDLPAVPQVPLEENAAWHWEAGVDWFAVDVLPGVPEDYNYPDSIFYRTSYVFPDAPLVNDAVQAEAALAVAELEHLYACLDRAAKCVLCDYATLGRALGKEDMIASALDGRGAMNALCLRAIVHAVEGRTDEAVRALAGALDLAHLIQNGSRFLLELSIAENRDAQPIAHLGRLLPHLDLETARQALLPRIRRRGDSTWYLENLVRVRAHEQLEQERWLTEHDHDRASRWLERPSHDLESLLEPLSWHNRSHALLQRCKERRGWRDVFSNWEDPVVPTIDLSAIWSEGERGLAPFPFLGSWDVFGSWHASLRRDMLLRQMQVRVVELAFELQEHHEAHGAYPTVEDLTAAGKEQQLDVWRDGMPVVLRPQERGVLILSPPESDNTVFYYLGQPDPPKRRRR